MKVITIFSGKGGVGKTTFSIMLASWLKYKLGERVFAYDFESPESRMVNRRNQDLNFLKMGSPILNYFIGDNKDFYPIGPIKARHEGYSPNDLDAIAKSLLQAKNTGNDGYIICDFPGRFESKEAVYTLVKRGLIDLMVFPIQPEEQSIASMFVINNYIKQPNFITTGKKQSIYCFWNMVTRNDRVGKQDILGNYELLFEKMNIPFSKTRIHFVDSVKRLPTHQSMVVSTLCYPEINLIKAFPPVAGSEEPYINNLFREIKELADAV